MLRTIVFLVVCAIAVAPSKQDMVDPQTTCAKVGQFYAQGSSGLVSELLRKTFKRVRSAEQVFLVVVFLLQSILTYEYQNYNSSLLFQAGAYRLGGKIGLNNRYNAQPGTVVGFNGHVAVYIGNACGGCMFVDVQGPNKNARCLQHGYGSQLIYKAYY